MSEPSSHAPEWTAVHGPESTGSPAEQPPNTLATEVDASGSEGDRPTEQDGYGNRGQW